LGPRQNPKCLPCNRSRSSAMRSRRLTSWALPNPTLYYCSHYCFFQANLFCLSTYPSLVAWHLTVFSVSPITWPISCNHLNSARLFWSSNFECCTSNQLLCHISS
jgi:hypothetical protein